MGKHILKRLSERLSFSLIAPIIDSPAFDANSYYSQLLATSTLSTLLKQHNTILEGAFDGCLGFTHSSHIFLSEIRQLGGERQSLVYNHHHELIAASDTIRVVCREKLPSPTYALNLLPFVSDEVSRRKP
jgi:hypothetical protein